MGSFKHAEQGAGRYVVGPIEAFDQKNEMFKRPFWDPQIKALGKKFYFTSVPPRDKSGYRLEDQSIEFGVWEFCRICEKCAKKCPSKSIMFGEPTADPHNISNREGVMAWHINAETCLEFWAVNGMDCSNCIRSCPFNKPAGVLHDMVKWGIHNTPGLNKWFLWGDDVFGYGRKGNPDEFWKV